MEDNINMDIRERKNIDWEWPRTGCWGEYLKLKRRTWQEAGKYLIMQSFVTY